MSRIRYINSMLASIGSEAVLVETVCQQVELMDGGRQMVLAMNQIEALRKALLDAPHGHTKWGEFDPWAIVGHYPGASVE